MFFKIGTKNRRFGAWARTFNVEYIIQFAVKYSCVPTTYGVCKNVSVGHKS